MQTLWRNALTLLWPFCFFLLESYRFLKTKLPLLCSHFFLLPNGAFSKISLVYPGEIPMCSVFPQCPCTFFFPSISPVARTKLTLWMFTRSGFFHLNSLTTAVSVPFFQASPYSAWYLTVIAWPQFFYNTDWCRYFQIIYMNFILYLKQRWILGGLLQLVSLNHTIQFPAESFYLKQNIKSLTSAGNSFFSPNCGDQWFFKKYCRFLFLF